MAVETRWLSEGPLEAFLAQPEGGSQAGLLMLPMMYGVDPVVQGFAERFAQHGFTALVWNPYSGKTAKDPVAGLGEFVYTLKDEPSRAEQATWLAYLRRELGAKRTGVIGWCTGGRFSLLFAAHEPSLDVCVACYPSIWTPRKPNQDEDSVELASNIACPVQLLYAGNDGVTSVPLNQQLRSNLESREAVTSSIFVPGGNHGFMDAVHHPGDDNAWGSRLAWPQMVGLLQACLM